MHRMYRFAATLAATLALAASGASAEGLPGGASSLNETHGDWTVTCLTAEGVVRCAATQAQVSGENRQRLLTIELASAAGGNEASGVLVLPFGLRLDAGARLTIEEGPTLPVARFSTCLPAGCLVPLAFDAATVLALREAPTLSATVVANDGGDELVLQISLSGFASAFDRVTELTGD